MSTPRNVAPSEVRVTGPLPRRPAHPADDDVDELPLGLYPEENPATVGERPVAGAPTVFDWLAEGFLKRCTGCGQPMDFVLEEYRTFGEHICINDSEAVRRRP